MVGIQLRKCLGDSKTREPLPLQSQRKSRSKGWSRELAVQKLTDGWQLLALGTSDVQINNWPQAKHGNTQKLGRESYNWYLGKIHHNRLGSFPARPWEDLRFATTTSSLISFMRIVYHLKNTCPKPKLSEFEPAGLTLNLTHPHPRPQTMSGIAMAGRSRRASSVQYSGVQHEGTPMHQPYPMSVASDLWVALQPYVFVPKVLKKKLCF